MSGVETVEKPRRNVELLLLLLAFAVSIGANTMKGLQDGTAFGSDFWLQEALLAVPALVFAVFLAGFLHLLLLFYTSLFLLLLLFLIVCMRSCESSQRGKLSFQSRRSRVSWLGRKVISISLIRLIRHIFGL